MMMGLGQAVSQATINSITGSQANIQPGVMGPTAPKNAAGFPYCANITMPVGFVGPVNCDPSQGPVVYTDTSGNPIVPTDCEGFPLSYDQTGAAIVPDYCQTADDGSPAPTGNTTTYILIAVAAFAGLMFFMGTKP